MSVIRPKLPEDPIEYQPAAGFVLAGSSSDQCDAAEAGLERARKNVLERARKDLLGGADVVRPDQLLDAYNVGGARAEMIAAAPVIDGVISEAARRLKSYVETGKP